VILVAMVVHARSWFQIMPKTLPLLRVGQRRVSPSTITRTGWALVVVVTIALLTLAGRGAG
jgi:succinate dehydrogenase subunit C